MYDFLRKWFLIGSDVSAVLFLIDNAHSKTLTHCFKSQSYSLNTINIDDKSNNICCDTFFVRLQQVALGEKLKFFAQNKKDV